MTSKKKILSILLVVLLVPALCCPCTVWGGKRLLNWISFEIAWRVVNATYFDPTFGGVDWRQMHDRYQRQMMFASDSNYYRLINDMLWELDVSHLAVIPPGYLPLVEPTVFAEGSIGIDVRLLDGEVVITSVESGSPGDEAGLRPGFAIQSIDGIPLEQIAKEAELNMEPPDNGRHRSESITSEILSRIYGPPDTHVSIAYLDEVEATHEKSFDRKSRHGKTLIEDGFPPAFVEFETRRLDNSIGYIRFNWFHPALAEELPAAIESMHGAPGLIIDLRGNPGGWRDVAVAGVEQLVGERTLCSTQRSRNGISDIVVDSADGSYEGPVVVLIDVTSKSSSEFFAACTQGIGRAVIVGERSPGSVGPAELMPLPNGALLIYPVAQETTLDGTVLEDHGVMPDIEVALDRSLLLQGIDSQLEAAIRFLEQ